VHNLFSYIYQSLHASGNCANHQENNWVFATLGNCYSVWMTVWYAGHAVCIPCIPDSHPHSYVSVFLSKHTVSLLI